MKKKNSSYFLKKISYVVCFSDIKRLPTGRWFSPISSTNKTDRHDITEILLTVALNTIKQTDIKLFSRNRKSFFSSFKSVTQD
jgi:hypothetical protein